MQLSKTLFWDTDFDQIDWEKHAPYVVSRVLHRGTLDDFRKIIAHDGRECLSEILRGLRYMDRKPKYFASAYFGIP